MQRARPLQAPPASGRMRRAPGQASQARPQAEHAGSGAGFNRNGSRCRCLHPARPSRGVGAAPTSALRGPRGASHRAPGDCPPGPRYSTPPWNPPGSGDPRKPRGLAGTLGSSRTEKAPDRAGRDFEPPEGFSRTPHKRWGGVIVEQDKPMAPPRVAPSSAGRRGESRCGLGNSQISHGEGGRSEPGRLSTEKLHEGGFFWQGTSWRPAGYPPTPGGWPGAKRGALHGRGDTLGGPGGP